MVSEDDAPDFREVSSVAAHIELSMAAASELRLKSAVVPSAADDAGVIRMWEPQWFVCSGTRNQHVPIARCVGAALAFSAPKVTEAKVSKRSVRPPTL